MTPQKLNRPHPRKEDLFFFPYLTYYFFKKESFLHFLENLQSGKNLQSHLWTSVYKVYVAFPTTIHIIALHIVTRFEGT